MKKTIILLFLLTITSCNKALDLSTLDLGGDAKQYNLENNKNLDKTILKGHYEWKKIDGKNALTTIDNGEKVTKYLEINNVKNQFNYIEIPTDSTWDSKIVVYKDKIAEVNAKFSNKNAFKLIETVLKKLGKPSKIVTDITGFNENMDEKIYSNFKKFFPLETKLQNDSSYVDKQLTYPRNILWDKKNDIAIVGIELYNDGKLRLEFRIMSKQAYFDGVLYPPALPQSPFYEYLN